MIMRCPACDHYTQHERNRERTGPKDQQAHYYTCTTCQRIRRICQDERAELLAEVAQRPRGSGRYLA